MVGINVHNASGKSIVEIEDLLVGPDNKADNAIIEVGRTQLGDKVSGDRIVVKCRKMDGWVTVRGSKQHHAFQTTARMNTIATVEIGYTNIRK